MQKLHLAQKKSISEHFREVSRLKVSNICNIWQNEWDVCSFLCSYYWTFFLCYHLVPLENILVLFWDFFHVILESFSEIRSKQCLAATLVNANHKIGVFLLCHIQTGLRNIHSTPPHEFCMQWERSLWKEHFSLCLSSLSDPHLTFVECRWIAWSLGDSALAGKHYQHSTESI